MIQMSDFPSPFLSFPLASRFFGGVLVLPPIVPYIAASVLTETFLL